MDYLSKTGPFELRHHPADLVAVAQSLDAREQFIDEPIAHIRHTLFCIPTPENLQIRHNGFGEASRDSWVFGYSRPSRALASVKETSLPASMSASPAATARMKSLSSSAVS